MEHKSEYAERINMFKYSQYMNLLSGEKVTDWIKVTEKACDHEVTALYVDAITGGMSKKKASLNGDAGVCIDMMPVKPVKRYMADYRYSQWWCRPAFGSDLTHIPGKTQLLVLELEDGTFCVMVPVVNDNYRCVLKGTDKNVVTAELSSWYDKLYTCNGLALVYAQGKNPSALIENCVKEALKLLNNGTRHISERRYPELMEYLGWCSWDSMQIRITEEGTLRKCEELKEKNIPIRWAILDDMWAEIRDFYNRTYDNKKQMIQLMHRSSMYHFEADPIRFPNGLKHCISKMKEYGLKVGMWYPTTGYWRGIDPEGPAYRILKDYLMETEEGYFVPDWHQDKAYGYYNTFNKFFRQCGADFVKIDKQSMIDQCYKNEAPVGRVAREYHAGMEASVGEHFDNCMINCMCMGNEDMWSRSVSPISRCSDDFQPEDAAWFTKHIMQCSYNSLLQGQFYWCDWDMWWTDDSQAAKNSMMRAVSGGPIYVSDELERSRKEMLMPLALKDGKILRCDRPAIPTADCVTMNPVEEPFAMKLQNMAGEHGIMAVLNINDGDCPVTAKISGRQIDGFAADEYAVYDYFDQNVVMLSGDEEFEITLKNRDEYKLYIFAPVRNGFAAIGRTDKFIAPKTIQYVHGEDIVLVEEGPYAYVKDGKLYIVH